MAKYYLSSGNVRTVISADDAEKAALWVVHKVMQQVLPVYADTPETTNLDYQNDDHDRDMDEIAPQNRAVAKPAGPKQLGSEILVSEEGFGGADAGRLDTFELVCHWNQLMVALDRLHAIA